MTQLTFFDAPPAQRHSPTSCAAAESIAPSASTLRMKVYRWLQDNGPATDEEMQERIPMAPSTQRPRRGELVRLGLVRDSGETRKTRSGRAATVWTSKPAQVYEANQ